jgi:hypothetical protein
VREGEDASLLIPDQACRPVEKCRRRIALQG